MKVWVMPVVEELNVLETKGGIINSHWESPFNLLLNDSKNHS